jgi:hypothetical protein
MDVPPKTMTSPGPTPRRNTARKTTIALRYVAAWSLVAAAGTTVAQSDVPAGNNGNGKTAAFSTARSLDALPAGWQNVPIVHGKTPTSYSLATDGGQTVVKAEATAAASALMHPGDVDLERTPVVSWRWKIQHPIDAADNSVAAKEDAPARLVFLFDGDTSHLSLGERATMQLAKSIGGETLPYATLMYIWSNTAPVDSVVPNPHTRRVQMIVAAGGNTAVERWQNLQRNVTRDYERVFHEKPGRLIAYGVMTDTDNTGASTMAWYGDIGFAAAR